MKCPLWVKSGHVQCKRSCPLWAKADIGAAARFDETYPVASAICHLVFGYKFIDIFGDINIVPTAQVWSG